MLPHNHSTTMSLVCVTPISRTIRSRQGATIKISMAIIGLLVLCLCEVEAILIAKDSTTNQAAAAIAIKPLSANIQRQQWQLHQETDRFRAVRRSQASWVHSQETEGGASSPSFANWVEPLSSHPLEQTGTNVNQKATEDETSTSSQPGYWRNNELTPAVDQVEEKDGAQQLNWHEAQLARLHGLGPAEIAALSTWQHRLRLHPLPNRLAGVAASWHHQPPSFPPRSTIPLYGKPTTHSQQVLTPFQTIDQQEWNAANRHQLVHQVNNTDGDEINENILLLPLWPKRSNEMKKSEKENSRNRSAANRKDKIEPSVTSTGSIGSKPKAKGPRKQQQSETPHRPMSTGGAGVTTSATDGMVQHEHNARPGSSSSTSDVNRMNRNLATQFLLRSPRENRQYDVPIIGKQF